MPLSALSLLTTAGLLAATPTKVAAIRPPTDPAGFAFTVSDANFKLVPDDNALKQTTPGVYELQVKADSAKVDCDTATVANCAAAQAGLKWVVNTVEAVSVATPVQIPTTGTPVLGIKLVGGSELFRFSVPQPAPAPTQAPAQTVGIAFTCEQLIQQARANPPAYDAEKNRAYIVTTPNGNVVAGELGLVDENDTIEVKVIAPQDSTVTIRRTSARRDLNAFALAGAGTQVVLQTAQACKPTWSTLTDFAPGAGQIEITTVDAQNKETRSVIEFNVRTLYRGMLSFGGVWTGLSDPSFGTTTRDGVTVITNRELGPNRLLYAIFLTPFVWGPRDFEKEPALLVSGVRDTGSLLRHINPSLGLVVNNPLENALLGLSVDLLDGVVITAGVHVGHVSVLDPNANVSLGQQFSSEEQIPTAKKWRTSFFWSASVDLRAAVQLLQTVFGVRTK
ncbi:hypothetical protein JRI60_09170 [Archangium violaceum]|uniref:hypothetical protein n=1 Tax=Archangium violaceum TaxID=83451 RepID=UPI00195077F3|nr:hypothetical protein [Archangium violaceum]QRN99168.1 hypothetical protein JRI60_09170 [Archangium violaceum]